ncbi:MAG TPA: DUF1549 domain-containing protein, partial [Planctomycetia bacterium]|nr:DUF1549 domain-containing protein [Planctomycetia bacterium]
MTHHRRGACCALWFGIAAASAGGAEPIDYNREIRPVLAANCLACHGPDDKHREAGLRLDVKEGATRKNDDGEAAIAPGKPEASLLLKRIAAGEDERMPPVGHGERLTAGQIEKFKQWIAEGATYAPHWAFAPPRRPDAPATKRNDWARNPIDRFTLAKMESHGLAPSPEAERAILARRLSFDLLGLPPTPAQVREFLHDGRPDAYERLVDRMLASPHYGERWARVWLDIARYADSAGYGSDPLRTIWRFRDWTIDAFNRNEPFDRFTVKQLAGDLLPSPSRDDLVATAFHRNSMTNTEGGTDDEEFRVAAVKERTNTTMQAWMGLTAGCAQCHTHKFDPLSQKEYYQLTAFFNQTEDNDQPTEAPTMATPDRATLEAWAGIDREIAALRERFAKPSPELAAKQAEWERSLKLTKPWASLAAESATVAGGAAIERRPDGSWLTKAAAEKPETITVVGDVVGPLTAIRLEAIPSKSLPQGGSGRGADGNFVLSQLRADLAKPEEAGKPISARYVRIELPGERQFLHLAEVEAFAGGENVARGGKASQSSTGYGGEAQRAIDGKTDGDFFKSNSVTHTAEQRDPWWEVDLGSERPLERLAIWNRTDGNTAVRLKGYRVALLDKLRNRIWQTSPAEPPKKNATIALDGWRPARIAAASADHSQEGFPVSAAIDEKSGRKTGWGVAPLQSKPHAATFMLAEPLPAGERRRLRVTLTQRFHE